MSNLMSQDQPIPLPSSPTQTSLMTVRELAAYLHITPSTLYKLVERNLIPVVRLGLASRTIRFRREQIEVWLATCAGKPELLEPVSGDANVYPE